MHGGMEESGIDRTESFLFVASKKITLKQIFYENKEIELKSNDSIQVSRSSHRAYSQNNINAPDIEREKRNIPIEKRFRVWKKNNCYYISVVYPYEWDGTIEFQFKKKTYKTKIKEGFDSGKSDYAP